MGVFEFGLFYARAVYALDFCISSASVVYSKEGVHSWHGHLYTVCRIGIARVVISFLHSAGFSGCFAACWSIWQQKPLSFL